MTTPRFNLFSSLFRNTNRQRILHSPTLDATHRDDDRQVFNKRFRNVPKSLNGNARGCFFKFLALRKPYFIFDFD